MKRRIAWCAVLGLLAGAGYADDGANGPTITGETGYFSLFTGTTLPQGEWSFGLYYNNWDRAVAPAPTPPNFTNDLAYDFHRLSASVAYGITDRFEISVMAPYDILDGSENRTTGFVNGHFVTNEVDANGIGNVRVGAKWTLYSEDDSGFALNAFAELPTGDDDEGLVTGDPGFGIGLAYDVRGWVLNLGYRDPGDTDPDQGSSFDVAEEILAGVGYAFDVNDRLAWITELGATIYNGGDSKPDDDIDLITGGRLWLGDDSEWAFNFGFRTNLAQVDDTDTFCPLGGLIGLTYFPRPEPPPPPPPPVEEPPPPPPPPAPPPPPPPPPPPAPPPPPPPPPPPTIEEVCQFAAGSARVDNRCKATLDEVALRMKNDADRYALVIGYSDSYGGESSNQRISEQRADAVKSYLVTRHGIDPARITTEGRGSADPVGDNSTAAGRAQNRRAVIILKVR